MGAAPNPCGVIHSPDLAHPLAVVHQRAGRDIQLALLLLLLLLLLPLWVQLRWALLLLLLPCHRQPIQRHRCRPLAGCRLAGTPADSDRFYMSDDELLPGDQVEAGASRQKCRS